MSPHSSASMPSSLRRILVMRRMARQPLPHPRLVGLVHDLECDAVFCDDALGLGMAMMRRGMGSMGLGEREAMGAAMDELDVGGATRM
ncbi:hypothetical protein Droror1_Dr00014112 [Drosera rotundifolia]